jgi:hypothetical protein
LKAQTHHHHHRDGGLPTTPPRASKAAPKVGAQHLTASKPKKKEKNE